MIRTIAVVALSLGLLTEADATCSVRGRFFLHSEGPWNYGMGTGQDEPCSHRFYSASGMIMKRLNAIELPRNGMVELRQGGYYIYKPNRGFRGPDEFMLQICGEENGTPGCASLKFTVQVD